MSRTSIAVAAFAALLVAAVLSKAGSALVVDAPRGSGTILVLAGETDRRPALAEKLLEQGYASRVVLDVTAHASVYGAPEVEIARKYVQGLPQGSRWFVCPTAALSTRDEVREAMNCVSAASGEHSILLVTSDFHTRRALSVMRREARGYDISVAAAHDSEQFGARWWTHRQWAKVCFDEWLRFLWWQAVDRWR